jgi:hypothetical protein
MDDAGGCTDPPSDSGMRKALLLVLHADTSKQGDATGIAVRGSLRASVMACNVTRFWSRLSLSRSVLFSGWFCFALPPPHISHPTNLSFPILSLA